MREQSIDNQLTPTTRVNKKSAFLDAFAEHANVMLAAKAAGVSRQAVYKWLEKDEQFSMAFNLAREHARDVIRAEIYRRAVQGWDEEVYQLAKYAGKVHKYSDSLLIFHAKMMMPEYREKQQLDVTVKIKTEWGGGALDEEGTVLHVRMPAIDE